MRLAFLFSGTNSPRARSISGLPLFSESFPPLLPLTMTFPVIRVRQSMFLTDTTGTPTGIKRAHRASVPVVPEEIISKLRYRAEWGQDYSFRA
jgi:hypothetical protein